jgi:plastocyanin
VFASLRVTLVGWLALFLLCVPGLRAQGLTVSATISVYPKAKEVKHKGGAELGNVVVWLVPMQITDTKPAIPLRQTSYRLVQRDKQFSPHLLVIPTGSSVEFPNEDAFFHNVFSLFNGKRFDLGLYESGTSRSVRFDREGVSYIFCNIHPEMAAVVLALSTPYFGVSASNGTVVIRNVPAGSYRLNVWGENVQVPENTGTPQVVEISSANANIGEIRLQQIVDPMAHHKNKFGEDYPVTIPPQY